MIIFITLIAPYSKFLSSPNITKLDFSNALTTCLLSELIIFGVKIATQVFIPLVITFTYISGYFIQQKVLLLGYYNNVA